MKQKLTTVIAILILGLIGFYWGTQRTRIVKEPVACTMEAKLCPDGSYVGRTGPHCEFAECSTPGVIPAPTPDPISSKGTIEGIVLFGPTCPVEKYPPDPKCADRLYATNLVLTTADQSRVIQEFSSGMDGTFAITAAPGDYAIRSAAASNTHPYCSDQSGKDSIHVVLESSVTVTVYCDSGIR